MVLPFTLKKKDKRLSVKNAIPKTRKAATWLAPSRIAVSEFQIPEISDGEILVKVYACSVCGSDIRIFKNGNPRVAPGQIIGHEIAGQIVALKGATRFSVGDNVSIGADVPCASCEFCDSGHCNCCRKNLAIGHQLEGGFTDYIKLDASTVENGPIQKFASSISFDQAALAEPLACCINGYEKCGGGELDSVLIFGAGPIGIFLGLLGKYLGANKVIMVDPLERRLIAASKIGACDYAVSFDRDSVVGDVLEITQGRGCDRVFTACPSSETHSFAMDLVSVMGVINLFGGLPGTEEPVALQSNLIHYKEAIITGSHGSTPQQHKKALELIEGGLIDVSKLITHQFPLDKIKDAYECAMTGVGLKIVIKPHLEVGSSVP